MSTHALATGVGLPPPRSGWPGAAATAGKPYAVVVLLQLHWFIRLRWLFAAGALAVLAIERFVLPEAERPLQLLIAVLSVAGTNVIWALVSVPVRRRLDRADDDLDEAIRLGQLFASVQIAVDLLLLTWILSLTGGIENPMALFYLFHVAITGLLLRTWQAFVQSVWAVLLYAGMAVGQMRGWLPYYPFLPHLGPEGQYQQLEHVELTIAVVALAVLLTLYFTDRIGKVLDQREDMLLRMNAALRQSQVAIEELQRRRSQFMQHAAHQLKSPLAMVQTFTNLIRDGIVTDGPAVQATCEKIVRRCREGIAQVTELLALARIQEGDPRRHQEAASDLGKVAHELCLRYLPVAQEKSVDLSWQIPENAALGAHVTQADLADCASNLIDNAVKYTPRGGSVQVTVLDAAAAAARGDVPPPPDAGPQVVPGSGYVYLVVKDSGIGIDEPLLMRAGGTVPDGTIFDAFRRGNNALAAGIPGTGLGLSIVRAVVEQTGGYLHVYSRPGQGTTFTVAFPALGAAVPAVLNTRSSEIVVEDGGWQTPSASAAARPVNSAEPPGAETT